MMLAIVEAGRMIVMVLRISFPAVIVKMSPPHQIWPVKNAEMRDAVMLSFQFVIVGIAACVIFDLWQRIFQKLTAIPPSNWALVGRWSLGLMTNGQLIARDLEARPERRHELALGWAVHYGVAIGYAAVFAWLLDRNILDAGFLDGLVFGVISVLVPWLFFLPCLGKGIMARLTPNPPLVCALALMMHSLFGVSIGLGFAVLAG